MKRIISFSEDQLLMLIQDELVELKEPERSNLHSFYVNLYAYRESVSSEFRPMEIETIFKRCMLEGPSFAKWLDIAKSAWLGIYAKRRYYSEEVYDILPVRSINTKENYLDVSGIFRSNSLYHWTPENPDLRDITSLPVTMDPSATESFRMEIRGYLENPIIDLMKSPNWKQFVRPSDRGTYDSKNYLKEDFPPARARGKCRIAYVPRELKGSRAAPVNEYTSALTIRWIDKAVAKILSFDNRDVSRWEPIRLKRTLEKNIWGGHSYCRDFNKEGLTKPRQILRIMMEELYARTKWPCFQDVGFFDEWTYDSEGETFSPPRGHGLGCANALTTLMSITIEAMVTKRCGIRPKWSGYNNDDAALIFKSNTEAETYGHFDRIACDELSLEFKPKASYIAKGEVVLCEQYACTFNKTYGWKGSFYVEAFLNLLKCRNAAHAQNLARATDVSFVDKRHQQFIMDYWGFVLFRNEQSRPLEFGGWFSSKIGPVLTCFAQKDKDEPIPREEDCAIKAFEETDWIFRKWDKRVVPNRLYNHFDEGFLDRIEEPRTLKVRELARPSMDSSEDKKSWDYYMLKLKKAFARACSDYDKVGGRTYKDLYDKWCGDKPEVDIIPPRGLRIVVHAWEDATSNKEFHSPYGTVDLEHDLYLYKRSGSTYPNLSREGKVIMGVYKSRKSNYRDAINRTKEMFPNVNKDWETYLMPPMEIIRNMVHPFEYTRACDLTLENDYELVIPIENHPGRDYVLNERRKILPDLHSSEWLELGRLKPVDMLLMQILYPQLEGVVVQKLIKSFCKHPGFGAIAIEHDPEDWPDLYSKYKQAFKRSELYDSEIIEKLVPVTTDVVVPVDAEGEFPTSSSLDPEYEGKEDDYDFEEDFEVYEEVEGQDPDETFAEEYFYTPPKEPPDYEYESDELSYNPDIDGLDEWDVYLEVDDQML